MSCDEPEYYCYECDRFFDEPDGNLCPLCGSPSWVDSAKYNENERINQEDDFKEDEILFRRN